VSGKRLWVWLGLLFAVVLSTMLLAGGGGGAAASSALSVAPSGLLAARRYLEARGRETILLDRPLQDHFDADVCVVAFPWQRATASELSGVQRHLTLGGTLLVLFSGERSSPGEDELFSWLGLSDWDERRRPPLNPLAWYRFAKEEWTLTTTAQWSAWSAEERSLLIRAPHRLPKPPPDARVWFRGPDSEPVVFSFDFTQGSVWVLPAEVLSNARVRHRGNLDFIETVAVALGERWAFDEYHHGLSSLPVETAGASRLAFDVLLVHLALLYVAIVFRLGQRFGPAWRDAPVVSGSTTSFLVGLGALHHRLGHHGEAARRLVERAREIHPGLSVAPPSGSTPADLVALARAVARETQGKSALGGGGLGTYGRSRG